MLETAELEAMQDASASAMPDTCTITRTVDGDVDPVTGVYSGTATTVYSGACRSRQYSNSQDASVMIGDLSDTLGRYVLTLPASATGIAIDDVVTISTDTDGDLDGRTFYVAHVPKQSWLIDRRLIIEDRER